MTTKLEQAARQALEALESVSTAKERGFGIEYAKGYVDPVITTLREALAEQAEQEPVGWSPEAKKKAWDFLKQELKNPDDPWTVSESATYFGFFCWGIEAARQWALDQAPIHVENVCKRGNKYFAWIGDDYVQIYTAPVQQVPDASPPVLITDDEMSAFRRFIECAQDGEDYDVPKQMMKRLAEIGVIQSHGFGRYSITEVGRYFINKTTPQQAEQEPVAILKSSKENFERQFGKHVFADWIYDDLTYSFENAAPVRTKDLTDDEIEGVWIKTINSGTIEVSRSFARAVIAADRKLNGVEK